MGRRLLDDQASRRALPGIHAALVESYEADAEVIDPRIAFEVNDPAQRRKLNRDAPHSKQMRRTAQRLRYRPLRLRGWRRWSVSQ